MFACVLVAGLLAGDDEVVFRSDVSLVRVDAQVIDSGNRAITHLQAGDFVLREGGRVVPIRNFASEDMPVDVLFLLDVSGSMRPHVQRIADASGQALTVLGKDDRMGIMVFDRSTRVRLGFSSSRQEVQREFDHLLRQERFNGGTDITRAMLDGADYVRREGRRDARRAIVILTDDQTEFDRDDVAVGQALARADAVMCALIAPMQWPTEAIRAAVGNAVEDGGMVLASVARWVASSSARAAEDLLAVATREAEVDHKPSRPARQRSHAILAATACRSMTQQR